MSWAAKRKLIIIILIAIPVLTASAYVVYPYVYPDPTCFDGRQNGDEVGVDCGGQCKYLCLFEVAPVRVEFARPLQVAPGLYTVVSYLQNPNADSFAEAVTYTIELFDEKNVNIMQRTGSTYVMPGGPTPIVETGFKTGGRTPVRAVLTIPENTALIRSKKDDIRPTISRRVLTGESSAPRLEATISNPSLLAFENLEVAAIIFDTDGNARAASKTVIASLKSDESRTVVFTWPSAFGFTPGRIDVLPRVSPL